MIPTSTTDGVATILRPGREGELRAQLTFGVGLVNEPLPLRGVTHLIEHLAMFGARDTPIEVNADVDLETTNFYAAGSPERVVRFLGDVCTALGALPLDRLAIEKGVLEAEGASGCHPIVAALLSRRYGARYAGAVLFEGAGVAALTDDQVRSFADRWYVAENAVLHLVGTPPDGFSLHLPPGPGPSRDRPAGWLAEGPVMVAVEDLPDTGAGVLLRLPRDDASHHRGHVIDVLSKRIEDECRHRDGHTYATEVEVVTAVDGIDVVVRADAREGKEVAVAQAVVQAVHDLASEGPRPHEVARSVAVLQEAWAVDGEDALAQSRDAIYGVLGVAQAVPGDSARAQLPDPEEIRRWFADALSTAVFYVPPAADPGLQQRVRRVGVCEVVAELPEGRVFRPHLLARALYCGARAARLVRAGSGIAEVDEDGIHVVDWDDIAGVATHGDSFALVIGGNGCGVTVGDDLFRSSNEVLHEVLRRVDAALVFEAPELRRDSDGDR